MENWLFFLVKGSVENKYIVIGKIISNKCFILVNCILLYWEFLDSFFMILFICLYWGVYVVEKCSIISWL